MKTVMILTIILVLVCVYIVKRSIYQDTPKWKEVYFFIIKHQNDGTDSDKIKTNLVNRYGLTEAQAEAALMAAENADLEWFETAIWR